MRLLFVLVIVNYTRNEAKIEETIALLFRYRVYIIKLSVIAIIRYNL